MSNEAQQTADLSKFACLLGLPEQADEAAIVAAIERQERKLIREALGLPEDAGLGDCLARITALRRNENLLVVYQLDALGRMKLALRDAVVKDIMLYAVREARDTLDP
ncbi:hypothetical protein EEDFHM_03138 [Methylorubrum populi]